MIHVGLTGGIGSGKSSVARLFAGLGAETLDADRLVREMLLPGGEAVEEVASVFGEGVLAPEGGVDRKALAAKVFGDEAARRRLEGILHPRVLRRRREILRELEARRGTGVVVVTEAALIFEAGTEAEFDAVILVVAPEEVRRRRLLSAGWDDSDVTSRMAAQWSDAAKGARADWIIDNGGTGEETERQVRALWPVLEERARAPR
jgi:dephospho-CoA kinase